MAPTAPAAVTAALLLTAASSLASTGTAFLLAPPSPPAAAAAASPATRLHATTMHNQESQPQPQPSSARLSRSQLLQRQSAALAFGGAALLLRPAGQAGAAVPTIQEYYGGGGAQPKTNSYIVSGKAKKAQQEKEDAQGAAAEQQPLPSDPRALLGEVDKALGNLTPLIKAEGWDDILALSKKRPLNALLTPYLGYGSVAALAKAAGTTAAQAKSLEEARADAGLTLQQLVDYAFSNRVVFFNALDKQQVAALAAQRPNPPDLSEPLGLLSDTQSLLKGLTELL